MMLCPVPRMTSKQTGDKWVVELLRGLRVRFHDSFMMSQEIFMDLSHALEEKCGFRRTRMTASREILALTIYILSHNESNRKTIGVEPKEIERFSITHTHH
ncbi:hypothetical protein KSP40_PGU000614 [Platanthera guangdongensis]|uniref:DUF8040 domain-containing protein n=1 Tax=Platanthera guangdongensis TaxID=2320717 RepID=A0ABR2LKW4_9ASPA